MCVCACVRAFFLVVVLGEGCVFLSSSFSLALSLSVLFFFFWGGGVGWLFFLVFLFVFCASSNEMKKKKRKPPRKDEEKQSACLPTAYKPYISGQWQRVGGW